MLLFIIADGNAVPCGFITVIGVDAAFIPITGVAVKAAATEEEGAAVLSDTLLGNMLPIAVELL